MQPRSRPPSHSTGVIMPYRFAGLRTRGAKSGPTLRHSQTRAQLAGVRGGTTIREGRTCRSHQSERTAKAAEWRACAHIYNFWSEHGEWIVTGKWENNHNKSYATLVSCSFFAMDGGKHEDLEGGRGGSASKRVSTRGGGRWDGCVDALTASLLLPSTAVNPVRM